MPLPASIMENMAEPMIRKKNMAIMQVPAGQEFFFAFLLSGTLPLFKTLWLWDLLLRRMVWSLAILILLYLIITSHVSSA